MKNKIHGPAMKGCRFHLTNSKERTCLTKLSRAFLTAVNFFCLFNKFWSSKLAIGFSFNLLLGFVTLNPLGNSSNSVEM